MDFTLPEQKYPSLPSLLLSLPERFLLRLFRDHGFPLSSSATKLRNFVESPEQTYFRGYPVYLPEGGEGYQVFEGQRARCLRLLASVQHSAKWWARSLTEHLPAFL